MAMSKEEKTINRLKAEVKRLKTTIKDSEESHKREVTILRTKLRDARDWNNRFNELIKEAVIANSEEEDSF